MTSSRAANLFSPKRLKKAAITAALIVPVALGGTLLYSASASQIHCHPVKFDWYHKPLLRSYDHASLRRGFQVYKQVCHACHALSYLRFRHFVGVTHTEQEMTEIAAEYQIDDEPDDDGNVAPRPRELKDAFPDPYDNENQAKARNGGAEPPDLSKIVIGREGHDDYIFSLMLGYEDPPEDMTLREGQYFNIYFPGNVIGMGPPLYDGQIEYEDGTPATASQMAKDVTHFLTYCSYPVYEDTRKYFVKGMILFFPLAFFIYWFERRIMNYSRSIDVIYKKFNWRR